MRALKFIIGHVIYNPAYTYKFQMKTTQDCLCYFYNIGFGYAKDHNLTMEKVYENILVDLKAEENVTSGLSIILDRMANSSGKYNVSEFLHPESDEWLYMENIEALYSFVAKVVLSWNL